MEKLLYQKLMYQLKVDGKKRFKQKDIASKLNIKANTLSEYYSGRYTMDFLSFVSLIRVTYEGLEQNKKAQERLKEFVKLIPKSDHIVVAAEWAAQTGNNEVLNLTIDRMKASGETGSQLARVYSLLAKRNQLELKSSDFFIEVEKLKKMTTKSPEMKVLLDIASLYSFFDLHYYDIIPSYSHLINLDNVQDPYVRKAYSLRKALLSSVAAMKCGEVEKARKLADQLIDVDPALHPLHVISAYNIKAELNAFTNYKVALECLNKALNILKRVNQYHFIRQKLTVEATSDFIRLFHGDYRELFLTTKSEQAHYFARIGRCKEGLEVLEQLEQEQSELTAFQLYYKALLTKDDKFFLRAKEKFIEQGELYYSKNLFCG